MWQSHAAPFCCVTKLLCFAVRHVPTHDRVVLLQLKAARVVTTILHGGVGVAALRALQPDHDAVALFAGHMTGPLDYRVKIAPAGALVVIVAYAR